MKHFLSPDRMVANSPAQIGEEASPPTTPSAAKPKRKCRLIIHPPKTPSPKKPKRGCRLTIHPPTQNHAKTQYLPTPQSLPQMPPNTSAAQKKKKPFFQHFRTRAQLRTPANKTYYFPTAQKARNKIRNSHFLEVVHLGVTPLIHKCEDMGDLGLSGVEMEDEERGERGELEFGTGLKAEMEEDDVKRGKMAWLKEKLWGKGTWAVCTGREEEEEMERELMCLARAAVPLMGAHDEDEMEINGGPSMKTEIPNMGDHKGDFSEDDVRWLLG